MQYIVTDTPKLSTSFTTAYCRRKNCLNIKAKYSQFCNQCLNETALLNGDISDESANEMANSQD